MDNEINIFDLEKKLISSDGLENQVPAFVMEKLEPDDFLQPTGIGYDDEIGWFILGTGQGPFLIWRER